MSLQKFIETRKEELIKRTRAKVALRASPEHGPMALTRGVPIFLSHLSEALGHQDEVVRTRESSSERALSGSATERMVRSAGLLRLHGEDLRKLGFTLEQVVYDYGDVCQAVTELAIEEDAPVTTAEFQRLDRCLDDAIAGAVSSWTEPTDKGDHSHDWLSGSLKRELGRQLDAAIALGDGGATATMLTRCVVKMRALLLRDGAYRPSVVESVEVSDRTTARIALPETAGEDKVEADAKADPKKVFVVDRDPHVRRLMRQFASDAFAFEFFDDGTSALERVRRSPPSALITEVLIPGFDGLALCRMLKGDPITERVPILVFSMLAAGERARQSGANGFLNKPLEKALFVSSLHGLTTPTARGPLQPQQAAAA